MQSLITALLALSYGSLASASPNPSKGRFSVPIAKRSTGVQNSGEGMIEADGEWRIGVEIGTPPQLLWMLPDTGAPSLAVRSIFLPSNETGNGDVYDPSKSSTAAQLQGYTYANCYGGGHCGHGVVFEDVVVVGGIKTSMPFEVSTGNNGKGSPDPDQSGDFGLSVAPNGMTTSPHHVKTWFQTVMPQLDAAVFTIDYNQAEQKGQWDFGFIDTTKYTGSLGYTPVAGNKGFWSANIDGFAIGSNGQSDMRGWLTVVDSGTASSAVPQYAVDAYFSTVQGATWSAAQRTYTYPCQLSSSLPEFIYIINTHRIVIDGAYIAGPTIGNGRCTSHLKAGNDTVIFGQSFIQSQFVVFDYAQKRIGFASKPITAAAESPSGSSASLVSGTPAVAAQSTIDTSAALAAATSSAVTSTLAQPTDSNPATGSLTASVTTGTMGVAAMASQAAAVESSLAAAATSSASRTGSASSTTSAVTSATSGPVASSGTDRIVGNGQAWMWMGSLLVALGWVM